MTTAENTMTTAENAATAAYGPKLRNLYFVRFAFELAWVGVVTAIAGKAMGPSVLMTVLLVAYPVFDAAAVLWQLRADPNTQRSKASEWAGVGVSVGVAIALAITSPVSGAAAVGVWGVWAIVAGVPQLITAIRNWRSGGQIAQVLSGGISVFAGTSFILKAAQGNGEISGVTGYATLGAIFFLVSAVHLSIKLHLHKEHA